MSQEGGRRALLELPVGALRPGEGQPRRHFDAGGLAELAASIARHGVLHPLLVTEEAGAADPAAPAAPGDPMRPGHPAHGGPTEPTPDGGRAGVACYRIVAGERRWRAAMLAGLATVPAMLLEAPGTVGREMALIENLQRSDLRPLELAQALEALLRLGGLTQEELAQRLGKSRVAVTNTLRLLGLGYAAQRALAEGRISEGHGRALLGAPGAMQERALVEVLARDLTVRQTEALARRLAAAPARQRTPVGKELGTLADALRTVLGARVALSGTEQAGRIVIEYHSREELERLCERIGGDELAAELA